MKKGQQKALILAFAAIVALGGIILSPFASAQDSQTQTKLSNDYQKAVEIIRQNYVADLDQETLTKAAIQGMLKSLDPHSDYMDRKAFQEFSEKQRSEYFGIGAQIGYRNRATYVIEPFKRSPRDARPTALRRPHSRDQRRGHQSMAFERVRNNLVGLRGTEVTVTVKRPGVAEPITTTITRDAIAYPSIPNYYMVKPNIGYIGLTRNFQATTNEELTRAMARLREQGADSFILDLRGNGGGYLDQAILVADRLLQRGQTIVSTRGRPGRGFDQGGDRQVGRVREFPACGPDGPPHRFSLRDRVRRPSKTMTED